MTHRAAPGRRAFTPPGKLRKLSPLTPLLEMWTAVAAFLALVFFNLLDAIGSFYRSIQSGQVTGREIFLAVAVIVGILGSGMVMNYLAWLAMGFRLTDDSVVVHSGVIFRTKHHVRLDRIQTVDVVQPLIARPFGLGEIVIEAAGGSDSKASIRFLPMKDIELDRAEILEAVRLADARPGSPSPAETHRANSEARVLYGPISTGRVLGSTFLGHGVGSIAFAVAMLGLSIYLGASLIGAVAAVVAVIQAIWSQVNRGWHGRGNIEGGHLNLVYGLTEERKQSIPLDRIHAVEVQQPLLWRPLGWWRVRASIAGYGNSSKLIGSSTTLLPVGTKEEMFAVVSAVHPEFVWQRMFVAEDRGWLGSPRIARWLSLMDAHWQAVRLDADGISLRKGLITKHWSYVPYERVQGYSPTQGPVERFFGLTSISIDLVPGPISARISQQPSGRAAKMVPWLHQHCVERLK